MRRSLHRLSGVVVVLAAACAQSGPTSQPILEAKTVATASASAALPSTPDASSTSEIEDSPQERTIALQGAPLLTIRRNNAALIEVSLAPQDKDPGQWETLDLERRVLAGEGKAEEPRHHQFTKPKGDSSRTKDSELWRNSLQSSKPGTVYGFRARSSGDWSQEVTISVPVPKAPPPSPTALTAQADTPFSARLRWEADSQRMSGFEIRVASQRVALVNPTAREFVQHRLVPGRVIEYELRAFNSRGVSEPAVAKLTWPAQGARTPARAQPPGPCLPPNFRPAKHTYIYTTVENIPVGNGLVLSLVPGPEMSRYFVGKYKGCPREFGRFEFQADVSVVPDWSDEGWPLLHAIAGAGMQGSEIDTLRFSQGHYTIVDRAFFCGEPYPDEEGLRTGTIDQELSLCAPPFDECQMDY